MSGGTMKLAWWIDDHKDHRGKQCLIWPFSKMAVGYPGTVTINGKRTLAHRLMCEAAHGPPPTKKHQVAHSCGNGYGGCINPMHLRWATSKENHGDRKIHGTVVTGEDQSTAKMTEKLIRRIRQIGATKSQRKIAAEFGIAQSTVGSILRKETWRHVQ